MESDWFFFPGDRTANSTPLTYEEATAASRSMLIADRRAGTPQKQMAYEFAERADSCTPIERSSQPAVLKPAASRFGRAPAPGRRADPSATRFADIEAFGAAAAVPAVPAVRSGPVGASPSAFRAWRDMSAQRSRAAATKRRSMSLPPPGAARRPAAGTARARDAAVDDWPWLAARLAWLRGA